MENTPVMLAHLVDCRRSARHLVDGRSFVWLLPLALVAALVTGCTAKVQDNQWPGAGSSQAPSPIEQAKAIVQRYADGEPLGSEAMGFDDIVQQVTAADAGKGAKVKKFFDDIQKRGVDASAAKALLKDL